MINLSSNELITLRVNPKKRAHYIIGDADLEIQINSEQWIEVGAGSLGAITKITQITNYDQKGCICRIGRLVEVAEKSNIQCGGNHKNDEVINSVFSSLPLIQYNLKSSEKKYNTISKNGKITTINSGVVIGESAIILSGVQVGVGAVVGAGSVVVKDVDNYAIFAGNPARFIRQRDLHQRIPYWNLKQKILMDYLNGKIADKDINQSFYRDESIKIVLSAEVSSDKWTKILFKGVKINNEYINLNQKINNYFQQIETPSDKIIVSTDISEFIKRNIR
jgi:acetyltransferase-like isoleucine patch superfamily enzyme